jgi:hypothetical protein
MRHRLLLGVGGGAVGRLVGFRRLWWLFERGASARAAVALVAFDLRKGLLECGPVLGGHLLPAALAVLLRLRAVGRLAGDLRGPLRVAACLRLDDFEDLAHVLPAVLAGNRGDEIHDLRAGALLFFRAELALEFRA